MVEGGLDAVVLAAYFMQAARTAEGHAIAHAAVRGILERTRTAIATNAGQCGLALTADDALRLKAEGKRAIFLSTENAYSLGTDSGGAARFTTSACG